MAKVCPEMDEKAGVTTSLIMTLILLHQRQNLDEQKIIEWVLVRNFSKIKV